MVDNEVVTNLMVRVMVWFSVHAGGGTPLSRSIFCSTRSMALKAAHVHATAGSLCHSHMARGKRWDCVMDLDAAARVCPSEYGWLALSAMNSQSSMTLK